MANIALPSVLTHCRVVLVYGFQPTLPTVNLRYVLLSTLLAAAQSIRVALAAATPLHELESPSASDEQFALCVCRMQTKLVCQALLLLVGQVALVVLRAAVPKT